MVAIINIGKLVSGDIKKPILDADTVLIENGKITQICREGEVDLAKEDYIIDVNGMTVTPGLIDSHVHVVIGDYIPKQAHVYTAIDFIEASMHGGVTTMISAGEVHIPERPRDCVGAKALAMLAAMVFKNFRPGGVKVHAGAVILEPGLTERDFKEMAEAGVKVIGEIGLGGVYKPEHGANEMLRWGRKYGIKSMMHVGGTSLRGVPNVTADDVIAIGPDVAAHINGGPTAPSLEDVEKLIKQSKIILEVVQCGNPKVMLEAINLIKENSALDRVIIGNDMPSSTGVMPLGILRTVVQIASLNDVSAEEAIAMATGNTARVYELNTGRVEKGKEADLLVMDSPMGSVGRETTEAIKAGDLPGIAMVMIDGEIKAFRTKNTPPPVRSAIVKKGPR